MTMFETQEAMEAFNKQLKALTDGTGIVDKDTLYFGELNRQNRIYLAMVVIGCMAGILGFLL